MCDGQDDDRPSDAAAAYAALFHQAAESYQSLADTMRRHTVTGRGLQEAFMGLNWTDQHEHTKQRLSLLMERVQEAQLAVSTAADGLTAILGQLGDQEI